MNSQKLPFVTVIFIVLALITQSFSINFPKITAASETLGLFVRFHSGSSVRSSRILSQYGLRIERYYPQIDVWWVKPSIALGNSSNNETEALRALSDDPNILWAEPNGLVSASHIIPNDPNYFSRQANLPAIGLPQAWHFTTGTPPTHPITIAIIDTGIGLSHPDLVNKIWTNAEEIPENGIDDDANGYIDDIHGWSFVGPDTVPWDDFGHGSHVAGIAGAQSNNGLGVAGVSWGADLMAVKVLNSSGNGSWADVAAGILYAADNQAQILNLSLGGEVYSQTLADAVTYAQSKGCLLVSAVGNKAGKVDYPSQLPGVLGVTAVTNTGAHWSYANTGVDVDLSAPGVDIFSTTSDIERNYLGEIIQITNGYEEQTGTSMATPHVSGVAALIWSIHPEFTATQVTERMINSARDLSTNGFDSYTGWGMVDAANAVPLKTFCPLITR